MKKQLFLIFSIFLTIGLVLAGCGTNQQNTTQKDEKTEQEQSALEETTTTINGSYYFTANEGGSISKIDVQTNEVVEDIKADGTVHNVQVSPDGKIVGATLVPSMGDHGDEAHNEEGQTNEVEHSDDHSNMNMGNESEQAPEQTDDHDMTDMDMKGSALFYDVQTNELIKEVKVGNHPAHIVFTSDGKLALVTNNEDNTVSVIDMNTFEVTKTISTGKGPHGFRISADDKFAYIANMSEDTVSVINLETLAEDKKITVGPTPVTTGLTSDGKTLVATLNSENNLAIVDLASGEVTKVQVGVGPAQVYIQSDNKYALVADQGTKDQPSTTVTKVDLATKKVVATIESGKGVHGVVVSPDNKFVYVTNMFENTVSVIDNEKNEVIKKVNVGEVPNGISIMPK